MPFKITIASGKGGTGKTTVAVNLFTQLNKSLGGNIELVDCDVEEPNDLLFFKDAEKTDGQEILQLIPHIDTQKCTYCRKCVEYCEFNAIVVIPNIEFAEVNKSLCHSCGACLVACKHNALTELPEPIGFVNTFKTKHTTRLKEGRLKIGSAMQTLLIKELKKCISDDNDIVILDSPPGTSCPVVETVSDADYVILVAEPTLFGLHDLKLMVVLLKQLKLPFGVIINKSGLGSDEIYSFLKNESIDIIGEIPFSKEYASTYATGKITDDVPIEIMNSYKTIISLLNKKIMQYEGDNYFKW